MNQTEILILQNLLYNTNYHNEVYHFIKESYFDSDEAKIIFSIYKDFINDYNDIPSKEALKIALDKKTNINDETYKSIIKNIKILKRPVDLNYKWLIKETEEYCKLNAVMNSVYNSYNIIKDGRKNNEQIVDIIRDAVSLSFDDKVGYDYLKESTERFENYKNSEKKIPLPLKKLNQITNGGVTSKTLTCFLGGTGIGKSIVLCEFAKFYFTNGKNVLYVSAEMSEEQLSKRIDANILGVNQEKLDEVDIKQSLERIGNVHKKGKGRLLFKEFPAGAATMLDVRKVITELQLKKKIDVDILIIDYLNIMKSHRQNYNTGNSYSIMKSIAEEMRALATEFDLPIFTVTQSNRSGIDNTNLKLENTSESIGTAQTFDLYLGLASTDELAENNELLMIQLKNRFGDANKDNKFLVGINRAQSTIYDISKEIKQIKEEPKQKIDRPTTKFDFKNKNLDF